MDPHEFVAIGDIVVDEFIRLSDPQSYHVTIDHEERELSMKFGSKIPFDFAKLVPAVGNSANAAVAASRLGLPSGLVVTVGKDRDGEACLASLAKDKVSTAFVKTHPDLPTNHHYVLWYGDERTILIKHQEYPYAIPEGMAPKWLYLSSIGAHGKDFHGVLAAWLAAHPETKFVFQPGTFQISMGVEAMRPLYQQSYLFFCNRQEAAQILGMSDADIKPLLDGLRALGPQIVVITDGPDGAYAVSAEGRWFVPKYPDPKAPYERTGAGDAFSSTVTAALALGLPLEKALLWGPVNSMSVVQAIGAQEGLLDRASLEALLANAPADYALTPLA